VGAEQKVEILEEMLASLITGLREVLRRTQKSLLHEGLPTLVTAIRTSLQAMRLDQESTLANMGEQSIDEIERMLARKQRLLQRESASEEGGNSIPEATESTYPRDIRYPANNHDNDKEYITQIKILPTQEEIRSEHPEFLPSTHDDQPHFLEGAERLIDTHFRLLRYDTFGEMKAVLSGLLHNRDANADSVQNPEASLHDAPAHAYKGAAVRHLTYSKRDGFEVQVSFQQPYQVRKKPAVQKERWWKEAKRLEEGSTLCLLSFDGRSSSMLFFTVSQKNTSKGPYGLVSDNYEATITAKLISIQDLAQLRLLITLSVRKNTADLLIEFPGLLLATFVPILENLQSMQSVARLPFKELILSHQGISSTEGSVKSHILSPLYTRQNGFKFDLQAILKDPSASLTLAPGSVEQDMPRKLELLTPLDKGQCEALIAALTREFVLIQGPPGTGKSYVGTQILRILVANKTAAKLGPIIVV